MGRRTAAALLLLLPVSGCGSSAEDMAAEELQARLDGAQSGHLAARSHDPYSSGADALESLDPYGYSVSTSIGPGGEVTMLRTIAAAASPSSPRRTGTSRWAPASR
ncbi:hypothetical protein [Blastococcus sp. TBT05-19]|uniref:hypothetical protein n=1 Tax=Blastococcus sp. TBT05-19 TaxID=2250581 RepID=UPI0011BDE0A6|nr:hypothetical protein [Blastococcus sp. TBT05-19]